MSDKTQHHTQQLDHAIATAFTCRSVIKYTSSLKEEQKNELLADIDTMLKFLRGHPQVPTQPSQRQPTDERPNDANGDKSVALDKNVATGKNVSPRFIEGGEADEKKYKQRLSEIYRVVQVYLSTKNDDGTSEFMKGFRAAMSAIDEVQVIASRSRVASLDANPLNVEIQLEKVRACLADVYSIFIEFARAISNVLQGSGIYIDTEEISSIQLERSLSQAKHKQKQIIPDLSPLLKVYETHLQLNEKKGPVTSRIDDATAFLIFIAENLGNSLSNREAMVSQLNKTARLLNDLSYLLSDYERVISALVHLQ